MAQPFPTRSAATYYVAPNGNDKWSGTLPEPNKANTDGPFASIRQAQNVINKTKQQGLLPATVTVQLRGGRYPLKSPIVFTPADSAPVTYAAYPGEQPILDGGERITGWAIEEVNGVQAWVTELPEVAGGTWHFRQLFVNGRRRQRPCLPKKGLYRIAEVPGMPLPSGWGRGGYDRFRIDEMKPYRNLTDIDVVAYHFWIDERFPVAGFDDATKMVTCTRKSKAPLTEAHGSILAPCFLENVFEALTEPGEWYLDRATGKLYYIPLPGETPENTEVYAPRALQLLRLEGDPENEKYVEFLRFEGLRFENTDWLQPGDALPEGSRDYWADAARRPSLRHRGQDASSGQGSSDVPAVVSFRGARGCALEDCRIANAGWYAVEILDGCSGVRVVGCELFDLGAGGIKINGAAFEEDPLLRCGHHHVTDNHIHECGRVFHSGIGILSMHSYANVLSHNHIHDLYYSGISVGWVWGYRPSISRDNRVEYNHIHDLGHGLLSDMGGIYTLGVSPGTVLRYNHIHDVNKLNYGAWCIYPDEGSSHLLIENNVCYRTNGDIFHQHYGRENTVRNNIFALGAESIVAHGRADVEHKGFSLERNILITDGAPIFKGGYSAQLAWRNIRSDLNLMWDVSGKPLTFKDRGDAIDLDAWKALGHDHHSVFADPKVKSVKKDNYKLAKDSPAITELDFEPIDLSNVGPRAKEQRAEDHPNRLL